MISFNRMRPFDRLNRVEPLRAGPFGRLRAGTFDRPAW
jgi:hypothetical protein